MEDKTLSQILGEYALKVRTSEEYEELKKSVEEMHRMICSTMDTVPNTGLTIKEDECMTHLANAFNAFNQLPVQRKHDLNEFVLGIHQLQRLIGVRHLRRTFPNYWVSENSNPKVE